MTFEQAMRLAGLRPRDIVPDGKWRRCATDDHPKKRNGAYVLHPDGRGFWRNWATDAGVNSWRDEQATAATPIDQEKLARAREREREQRIAAIRGAREFWNRSHKPDALHPYLDAKGLTAVGTTGLRFHLDKLVIPVRWNDKIISLQTITPEGIKRFWPGAPVKGGAFEMLRPRSAVTAVCEGLATGLAIYQSVRNASVIVAFDAGNLLPVIERMRPSGSVVVCADNDHGTQAKRGFNPGIEKATNAAELIGAGVAYPKGIEGTDFCDWLKEVGPGGASQMERLILSQARYVPRVAA